MGEKSKGFCKATMFEYQYIGWILKCHCHKGPSWGIKIFSDVIFFPVWSKMCGWKTLIFFTVEKALW